MTKHFIDSKKIISYGLSTDEAERIAKKINDDFKQLSPEDTWRKVSQSLLSPAQPFALHLYLFSSIYPNWPQELDSAPAWFPDANLLKNSNIAKLMNELGISTIKDFHHWTTEHYSRFWQLMLDKLQIAFEKKPQTICDLSQGIEHPNWLQGAKLNIASSCFTANPNKTAIIFKKANQPIQKITYQALDQFSNQIANSMLQIGLKPGDYLAIAMPMTLEAVAIYLGIIKMGGIVVSIADSFSAEEIAVRLNLIKIKMIFTQDFIIRDQKKFPFYEKILAAGAPKVVVLPCQEKVTLDLREQDLAWDYFLKNDTNFSTHTTNPSTPSHILFSSGTTGTPKAIAWDHTTAIKSASDAFLHQNIQHDDIVHWPTNLGWMMGPWVIFAALINQATLALYPDAPRGHAFGEFIQEAKITMLGVVPILVSSWRQDRCLEQFDLSSIRRFSSTGECSNPEDMLYLMSRAGFKPIIEYCGGTETGGAYISSTMIENNYPSVFTTPAMGIDFVLLDETGKKATIGEVALIPPSLGLSNTLLNADHHEMYFANMPTLPSGKILRRHGDQAMQLANGGFCLLGRVDDTMNLSGIKVSAAEIERALVGIEDIQETAAIAMNSSTPGPSRLVIFAATTKDLSKDVIKKIMQSKINQHLNPLFKIHDVIFIKELPKTASNKIMRRMLRNQMKR